MNADKVLAINPGSTSTKIAVFEGMSPVFIQTLQHSKADLAQFDLITDQFSFRKNLILEQLEDAEIPLSSINVVMGRGGLLKPVESGVFAVNQKMVDDLRNCTYGEHASNLGGLIAYDIARDLPEADAYIANPVVVDELCDFARLSGHPLLPRRSIFHALNQKAVARDHAKQILKKYEADNPITIIMDTEVDPYRKTRFDVMREQGVFAAKAQKISVYSSKKRTASIKKSKSSSTTKRRS